MHAEGFTVDQGALAWLRTEIQSLIHDLSDEQSCADTDERVTGDRGVADAVNRFRHDWRDGRQTILDELDQCARRLQQTVAEYERTETANTALFDDSKQTP